MENVIPSKCVLFNRGNSEALLFAGWKSFSLYAHTIAFLWISYEKRSKR